MKYWGAVIIKFWIQVTPYAGVWIEIEEIALLKKSVSVTPYAGVWIEIAEKIPLSNAVASLPTRECGLKSQ